MFCKKVDLSSTQGPLCTVSVFLFYILLIWGGCVPNAPPLPTGLHGQLCADVGGCWVVQACIPNDGGGGGGRDRLSPASPVVRLSDSDVSEMDVEEGSSTAAVEFDKRGGGTGGGRSSRSAAGVPTRSTSCSPTRIKQRTTRYATQ